MKAALEEEERMKGTQEADKSSDDQPDNEDGEEVEEIAVDNHDEL